MRMGLDLGGTEIKAADLDRNGETRFAKRIANPRHDCTNSIEARVSQVASLGASSVGASIVKRRA